MKLVLLHGFTGRGSTWLPVVRRLDFGHLASGRLQIDAPDLPGHEGAGVVPETLPADFEAAVDRIAERSLPAPGDTSRPVYLAGYSLGGRLALGLALRHPGRIAGLTLIGARPGMDGVQRQARATEDSRRAAELRQDLEGFVDQWQRQPIFESQKLLLDDQLQQQRHTRLGHDARGLAWALETLSPGRMPDWRGRLSELSMPVQLIAGALDKTYCRLATEMASKIPDAAVRQVPDAGHNVVLEAPGEIARLLDKAVDPWLGKPQTAESFR